MKRRETEDCGVPVGRLFRFIPESSTRRYFLRVHVPIPIGGVVNTVCPGIHPCYLIVSFHSKASSYTAAYTVILTLIRFFLNPSITAQRRLRSWLATDANVIEIRGISRKIFSDGCETPLRIYNRRIINRMRNFTKRRIINWIKNCIKKKIINWMKNFIKGRIIN